MTRLQTESHIVQELAVLVLLWVEEESEVVEYVIEQVVNNNTTLDLARKCINELIVFLDLAEPVVGPEVLEMLVDLAVE